MDARRFDTLARRLGTTTSRRSALGTVAASSLLGSLGLHGRFPHVQAADNGVCTLAFAAAVRQGPSVGQPLLADAARPGELRGQLQFSLSESGKLRDGILRLPDGRTLAVVGQAAGHSLQVRIELAPRWALVAVGVGEQEVAACRGAIDGVATGPEVGDLGDWHAAVLRQDGDSPPGAASASGAQGGSRRLERGRGTPTPGQTGSEPENTPCPSGLTRCGGDCADLDSDRNHCGACGSVCPALGGLVCGGGRCGCPAGWVDCSQAPGAPEGIDGYCADLGRNAGNCGACGAACPAGESCAGGKCQGSAATLARCAPGLAECDGTCVDLASNTNHCGACGSVCESGLVPIACRDGVCDQATCPLGEEYCGGVDGCRDLLTDPNHCGACQRQCAGGGCTDGRCAADGEPCPSGQDDCGEGCTDLSDNAFHCGACGNGCDDGQVCRDGTCVAETLQCATGLSDCSGVCVDLSTDESHCGACGTACALGQGCQSGACVDPQPLCPPGQTSCSSVCVETATDSANCGDCSVACAASETCQGGSCTAPTCPAGQAFCGVCTDLASDHVNCGTCGNACALPAVCCGGVCADLLGDALNCGTCGLECAYGEVCSGGACQSSCASGLSYCNGACVDTATDPSHCGFCNNPCGGISLCIAGGCISTGAELPGAGLGCAAGFSFCSGVCVDLVSDDLNCGTCGQACGYGMTCIGAACLAICGGQGLTFCNGDCVNTLVDDQHCGGCGHACASGLYCNGAGFCSSGT